MNHADKKAKNRTPSVPPSGQPVRPEVPNQRRYEEFIASLQLKVINLKQSSSSIRRLDYWKHKKKNVSYEMTAKQEGRITAEFFDAEAKLALTMTGENSENVLVQIEVVYDMHVHTQLATAEYVTKFCDAEIRLIVWPYFREFVMNMTARMYIPPMMLPLSDKEGD